MEIQHKFYQKELDEACFQHDVNYEDFKDLNRRIAADKVFPYKAFNIAKNPKYDAFQRGFRSMDYKFWDKKSWRGTIKRTLFLIKN